MVIWILVFAFILFCVVTHDLTKRQQARWYRDLCRWRQSHSYPEWRARAKMLGIDPECDVCARGYE